VTTAAGNLERLLRPSGRSTTFSRVTSTTLSLVVDRQTGSGHSIDGDTTVQGNLHTFGQVEFDGKVRVNGGTFVVSNWGVHIHGSLKIVNSVGDNTTANNGFWSDYSPTVIDGKFTYTGNNGWFYAEGQNTIYGKTTIGGNTHPFSGAGLTTHGHSSIS
jgi:hypothetical protein